MVAAALRSVFVQQEAAAVEAQWEQVIGMLSEKFPAAAALMAEAREVVLAFRCFPAEHWRKNWSTANRKEEVPSPIFRPLPLTKLTSTKFTQC